MHAASSSPSGLLRPGEPWKPPTDDELSWFRAVPPLPARPTPLQFTMDVQAFTFAFAHALVSLYFPLYRVHSRLVDGELYVAVMPSGLAEIDLERQMGRMRASTFRFSRNIRASWERDIRKEVEKSTEWMSAFPGSATAGPEAAEGFIQLRRTRANQWFDSIRAVFAPAALLQEGIGETMPADATEVLEDARHLVVERGTAAYDGA